MVTIIFVPTSNSLTAPTIQHYLLSSLPLLSMRTEFPSKLLQVLICVVFLCTLPTMNINVNAFTLITFDVDGTLVKGSGGGSDVSAHARAFSHAVGTVLGDGTPTIPVAHAIRRHKFILWIDEWLLAGQARPGRWEPASLEHGMANPDF
jgi:hypothetical protein